MSRCFFVHHISHMKFSGREPWAPRERPATNRLSRGMAECYLNVWLDWTDLAQDRNRSLALVNMW
jgi:hypothetical protein